MPEDESISLSDRLNIKPATFASLRMSDFSRISECMQHDFQECWYHRQLNCTTHRGQTHFSTPIRFPRVFGRGLEIGPCRDCLRMDNKQCTLSTADDRFFGIKTPNKIIVTMCKMRASRKNQYIGGKVDMMGLVVDSDDEDDEEDKDEEKSKEDGEDHEDEDGADSGRNNGVEGEEETDGVDENGENVQDEGVEEDTGQGNDQEKQHEDIQNNHLQLSNRTQRNSRLNKKRKLGPKDPDSESDSEFSLAGKSSSVDGSAKNINRIPPRKRRRILTTPKRSPENEYESRASATVVSNLALRLIENVPQTISPTKATSTTAATSPDTLSNIIESTPAHSGPDFTSISRDTPTFPTCTEEGSSKNTDITNNPFSRAWGTLESISHKINRIRVILDEKDKTLLEQNKIIQRSKLENASYVARMGRLYMEKDELSKELEKLKGSNEDEKVETEQEKRISGG